MKANEEINPLEMLEVINKGAKVWEEWLLKNGLSPYSIEEVFSVRRRYHALENLWLEKANLRDFDLRFFTLKEANLRGADFRGADFQGANLQGADFQGADFTNADLQGADFQGADLTNADLQGADLTNADLRGADLTNADFRGANLTRAILTRAILLGADLSNVDFRETYLGADFRGARFWKADFRKAELIEADFRGAYLSDADFRKALLIEADLTNADLTGANLQGAALTGANLQGAALHGANLTDAYFTGANLRGANLTGANLSKAKLMNLDLQDAILNQTDLTGADLTDANLIGANLISTKVAGCTLDGCNVYGISVWDLEGEPASQNALIITPEKQPNITVADLEVAQFIYLMLNNQNIRNVIHTITSKAVLILGRFYKDRKEVLDAIRDKLQTMDYVPIIFDFEPSANRNLTETVKLLAGMSKFVIADITNPSSVPQELTAIIPDLKSLPIKPIIWKEKDKYSDDEALKRPYAMFQDWEREDHVLKVFYYENKDHMVQSLKEEVVDKVEGWFKETPDEKIARESEILGAVKGLLIAEWTSEQIAKKLNLTVEKVEEIKLSIT